MQNEPRISESGYHRPKDKFQCGLASTGDRCRTGPTASGKCSTERCDPAHRMAWWERHIRSSIALFGICIIAILLSTPWHREFLAPGPLTQGHAQILQGPEHQNRCAACHDEGKFPAIAWIAPAHPVAPASTKQTELCIKCHIQDLPSLALRSPHDLSLERLDALTKNVRSRQADSKASLVSNPTSSSFVKATQSSPIHWRTHELACSDCHREHKGAEHDLTKLTQSRCQSCHIEQFQGLEKGHPEFRNYPYSRDSQIAFDHVKHRDLHFTKENKSFDCRQCHVQEDSRGAVGKVFRSVSFETACASCHNKPIQSSLSEGIVVFQLPSLDKKKLLAQGKDSKSTESDLSSNEGIENWPEEASQLMDGTIPAVMQLLLAGDEEGSGLLARLPSSTNLAELDLNKRKDRETTILLAELSRRLLQEIAVDGQKGIARRVARWLETPNDSSNVAALEENGSTRLIEGIPPDIFRTAMKRWFHESPQDGSRKWEPKPLRPIQHLPAGGWMIDERRMAIVYVPNGHADPWLTAWTSLAAKASKEFLKTKEVEDQSSWISGNENNIQEPPGSELLKSTHSGRCVECHLPLKSPLQGNGFASNSSNPLNAAWKIEKRVESERLATRFNHGPHLLVPTLDDCTACHRLNQQVTGSTLGSPHFVSVPSDPNTTHHPEFAPMRKSDCSQCHRPNAAGDSCTQCHNYHLKSMK